MPNIKEPKWWEQTSSLLLIAGGLNWGLLALLDFNLVEFLTSWVTLFNLTYWVYIAVGLAAGIKLVAMIMRWAGMMKK